MDTTIFKKEAKEKLKGDYIEICSAMILIFSIIFLIFSITNVTKNIYLMLFISVVLTSFLLPGLISMIDKITKEEKTGLEDLFSKANIALKTAGLTLSLVVIVGFFTLFLGVALYGLYTSSSLWGICDEWLVNLLLCIGIVLSVSLLVFTSYVALSFSQVYFIYNESPEMSIFDIFKKSYIIMDGHKLELFVMLLSFMGWILLGILTLGLLYIWLVPYILVSMNNFYNSITPKKRRRNKKVKKQKK